MKASRFDEAAIIYADIVTARPNDAGLLLNLGMAQYRPDIRSRQSHHWKRRLVSARHSHQPLCGANCAFTFWATNPQSARSWSIGLMAFTKSSRAFTRIAS